MPPLSPGDRVQTPFGKGVVREVRNTRVLVDVAGRALVLEPAVLEPVAAPRRPRRIARAKDEPLDTPEERRGTVELDLHGLTVEQALARAEQALNDALLAGASELRLIHGRSGGRIRAALHRRFRQFPVVQHLRIDPSNDGVTIVSL